MKSDFESDGFFVERNFLDEQQISAILSDLEKVFSKPELNGSIGYEFVSKVVKRAPNPFKDIIKLSPFFLINKICKIISLNGCNINNYAIAEFNALSEQGDKESLTWHIDQLQGGDAFLVIIYLEGGGVESGGAQYIKKSHKLAADIDDHYIKNEELLRLEKDIVDLSGKAGDLVCYKLNGFHTRSPTIHERKAIRVLFANKLCDAETFNNFVLPLNLLKEGIPNYFYIHEELQYLRKKDPLFTLKYASEVLLILLIEFFDRFKRKLYLKLKIKK